MPRRYLTIWFRHFKTDWHTRRQPTLGEQPFVLYLSQQGRMVITATNARAESDGIYPGTVLADARAILPGLQAMEDKPALFEKSLRQFALWFIRYAPVVAIDPPDGLILDISGVPHLWGGESAYLQHIMSRINSEGYTICTAIAGTIGTAWALTHHGESASIIAPGGETDVLLPLPVEALRIDDSAVELLQKLGLRQVRDIMAMPQKVLRRRFGDAFLRRLHQAMGKDEEMIESVVIPTPYEERLHCLENIMTRKGIDIALDRLLHTLCDRLAKEGKGLRKACFKAFRIDGKTVLVEIGTHRPSNQAAHLFMLFSIKLDSIAPGPGIELFLLEAPQVEDQNAEQEKLWNITGQLDDDSVVELLDKIANKLGGQRIHRYLPDAHYWPERSLREASSLQEKKTVDWPVLPPRPLRILQRPEPVLVTAPIPDYPPMLFRYKGKIHRIMKADGPERIEQEWWLQEGRHRDYYQVEDEEGKRYWLFRDGHYDESLPAQWYLHGFYA
jgi:protein ImuB